VSRSNEGEFEEVSTAAGDDGDVEEQLKTMI